MSDTTKATNARVDTLEGRLTARLDRLEAERGRVGAPDAACKKERPKRAGETLCLTPDEKDRLLMYLLSGRIVRAEDEDDEGNPAVTWYVRTKDGDDEKDYRTLTRAFEEVEWQDAPRPSPA